MRFFNIDVIFSFEVKFVSFYGLFVIWYFFNYFCIDVERFIVINFVIFSFLFFFVVNDFILLKEVFDILFEKIMIYNRYFGFKNWFCCLCFVFYEILSYVIFVK